MKLFSVFLSFLLFSHSTWLRSERSFFHFYNFLGAALAVQHCNMHRDLFFETRTLNKTNILVLCRKSFFSFLFHAVPLASFFRQPTRREKHCERERKSDRNQMAGDIYFYKRQIINNDGGSERKSAWWGSAKHEAGFSISGGKLLLF